MNEHMTFGKPSVGSVIPSVQRWLREPPGTDAEAEAQSLPKVSHLVGGARWEEEPTPKGKAIQFPFLEIHPDLLRSGTRCPSGKGAKLCRVQSMERRLRRHLQAPGGCLALWPRSQNTAPLGRSPTPPLEMRPPDCEVWDSYALGRPF